MTPSIARDSLSPQPPLDGQARFWLRLEGLAALITGASLYTWLGGDWIWFVPLLIVPDLSAIGYVGSPATGALIYNAFHNWAVGLAVLGAGLALGVGPVAIAGALLIGHTGMDRAAGYGLKLSSGFGDTHLGRMGRSRIAPGAAGTDGRLPVPASVATAAR